MLTHGSPVGFTTSLFHLSATFIQLSYRIFLKNVSTLFIIITIIIIIIIIMTIITLSSCSINTYKRIRLLCYLSTKYASFSHIHLSYMSILLIHTLCLVDGISCTSTKGYYRSIASTKGDN
jgi:ABC-type multidrug transport system permease subunit